MAIATGADAAEFALAWCGAMSVKDLACRFDIAPSAVLAAVRRMGLPARSIVWSADMLADLKAKWSDFSGRRALAADLGVSMAQLAGKAQQMGLSFDRSSP